MVVAGARLPLCSRSALKYLHRFVQQVTGAAEACLELLHRFLRASFLVEDLKSAVLFFEQGLLGVKHQVINW